MNKRGRRDTTVVITKVGSDIASATTLEQVDSLIRSASLSLSATELAQLDTASAV